MGLHPDALSLVSRMCHVARSLALPVVLHWGNSGSSLYLCSVAPPQGSLSSKLCEIRGQPKPSTWQAFGQYLLNDACWHSLGKGRNVQEMPGGPLVREDLER